MISMKILGAKEVAKSLNKGVGKPVGDALKKLAFSVERFSKKSTVVNTGRLRSSINTKLDKSSATIGTNVQYAEFIEYGTANMEARHMEGGMKVLGQGMFAHTEEEMGGEIKDFEVAIAREVKKRF